MSKYLGEPKLFANGGDHLGPEVWKPEPADRAIENAKRLLNDFISAGFSKMISDY